MTDEHGPELEDAQLLAYLDGEAEPAVMAHVEQCTHCRQRARQLALLQDRLTAGLYRHGCPPATELGEYHLGLLPQTQALGISRHLEDCPHCARELEELKDFMAELAPDVALGTLEQAKIVIAELVRGAQGLADQPVFAPAPAFGLRGEETGPLVYQADDYQIVVEIQRDGAHPGQFALLALVTGPEAEELEARLLGDSGQAATTPVDELGNLYFSDLSPGPCALNLSGRQVEIQIAGLNIGDA